MSWVRVPPEVADFSRRKESELCCFALYIGRCLEVCLSCICWYPYIQCYTAMMKFVSSFEALCPSQSSVRKLRAHPSFTAFLSKWSLPVYFQIRYVYTVQCSCSLHLLPWLVVLYFYAFVLCNEYVLQIPRDCRSTGELPFAISSTRYTCICNSMEALSIH